MDKLKKRAEELGLKFADDISEDDLKKLISDKEKALESDIEYWKAQADKWKTEAKTAFDKRDQFKSDREALSTKIKELEKSMKTMIPSEEKTKLEDELKELKDFKTEYDKKKEEEELKNKTALERLEFEKKKVEENFQKQLDELKAKFDTTEKAKNEELEKTKTEISNLRLHKLEAEIVGEAAKLDAWSPSQIYKLTKDNFTYQEDLGKFTYQERDEKGKLKDEISVPEYIKSFLSKEENENLIKSKVNTQPFNSQKTKVTEKSTPIGEHNPNDPEIIRKAQLESMTPEDYIKYVLGSYATYKKKREEANK